jgi:hypothetical protein
MNREPLDSGTSPTAELREAARLDSQGRHDEAIDILARGARLGDVEAMTRLGRRLVVGDRAPSMPRQGAGLLIDAVNRGGAEAAALLAILAATGVECQQSWPHAMQLLGVAAEQGSQFARSQLRVLGAQAAETLEAEDPGVWRRSAASVNLDFWMSASQQTVLYSDPAIRAFPRFVPGSVCDWLIERSRDRLGQALVYDPASGSNIEDHHRSNTAASFSLMETDLVMLLIQQRMRACCGIPLRNMEPMSVLHYAVGEEITPHFDFIDPKIPNYTDVLAEHGQRIVTFLVYLNADYEGGETAFPRLGVKHKGRRGEGLFFVNALSTRAPDLRMIHAGTPPTHGEKWVISQFIRDRAVSRSNDATRVD